MVRYLNPQELTQLAKIWSCLMKWYNQICPSDNLHFHVSTDTLSSVSSRTKPQLTVFFSVRVWGRGGGCLVLAIPLSKKKNNNNNHYSWIWQTSSNIYLTMSFRFKDIEIFKKHKMQMLSWKVKKNECQPLTLKSTVNSSIWMSL